MLRNRSMGNKRYFGEIIAKQVGDGNDGIEVLVAVGVGGREGGIV